MTRQTAASEQPARRAELVRQILDNRKYRGMDIPASTVEDLLEREFAAGLSEKEAVKAVKTRLHNIVAAYLGDPDYQAAARLLDEAFASGGDAVQAACRQILAVHASTRERLTLIEDFYPRLWQITGAPRVLVDLACALNPFALPWMALPDGVQYHAYDLHTPRIGLINHFFALAGLQPLGEVRDILVEPPQFRADVALFLKEAHRFDQRQKGVNRAFFQSVNTRWLLVSLPTESLSGRHDKLDQHRRLVQAAVAGQQWHMQEMIIGNEAVFLIDKGESKHGKE